MKIKFLKLINCPYCASDFEVEEICEEKGGEIINGSIRCECNEYPIVEKILILKNDPVAKSGIKHILHCIKKKNVKEAIALSLDKRSEYAYKISSFIPNPLKSILTILMKHWAKNIYKKYSSRESFYDLIDDAYLKHRFSSETFWSIYPFISLLKKKNERVLDMGCGTGHASFILSNYTNTKDLVCADKLFCNLYLAKKYFVNDAEFVCLDANYPLPFKSKIFSTILMLDTFHYTHAHASLAKELERILYSEGLLLLLHLHNSLVYNVNAGMPLPPMVWANLFHNLEIKLLPEKNLIEDFILRNKLDLLKQYSESEIDSSNAISIIGSKNKSIFDIFEKIGNEFLIKKDNLIINPIYKIRNKNGRIVLERNFPSELFRKEYPLAEKYLPEKYIISGNLVKVIKGRVLDITKISDLKEIENLMRRFIIINVPKRYL